MAPLTHKQRQRSRTPQASKPKIMPKRWCGVLFVGCLTGQSTNHQLQQREPNTEHGSVFSAVRLVFFAATGRADALLWGLPERPAVSVPVLSAGPCRHPLEAIDLPYTPFPSRDWKGKTRQPQEVSSSVPSFFPGGRAKGRRRRLFTGLGCGVLTAGILREGMDM